MSAKRFLQKIKQVIGLSGAGESEPERPRDKQADVTVERETSSGSTVEEIVSDDETATESPTETDEEQQETGEPVESIKGIGPTYSDRLADAGLGTVTELAQAEPEAVADAAQTGTTKAANWIERAQDRQ